MIYCMNIKERVTNDNPGEGDIAVYHGQGDSSCPSLFLSETFKRRKGYSAFLPKLAKHIGVEVKDVGIGPRIHGKVTLGDTIDGGWNDAEKIGHREIADLAEIFQKDFVEVEKKGWKTRISAEYVNLTAEDVLRMEYDAGNVIEFKIA